MGAPNSTSATLVDTATAASTPERTATDNVLLLLEFTRSFDALTRPVATNVAAVLLRALSVTLALASTARGPNEHVAVRPDTEQLPSELVAESMLYAALLGSVIVSTASSAAVFPAERTTN